MVQAIMAICTAIFRAPFYVFDTIAIESGVIFIFLSAFVTSILIVKVIQRFTSK